VKPLAPAITVLGILLTGQVASAQPPQPAPVVRADVVGLVGWLNVSQPGGEYDRWINQLGTLGAAAGWYWNDHLKTEIDFAVSSTADHFEYRDIVIDGRTGFVNSRTRFSSWSLAVGQQYQFYRNVWFHPHLGAGVDLAWETTRREDEGGQVYDPVTRQYRFIPRQSFPTEEDLVVRPFAEVGFKAYMSQRSFFRTDVRFNVRNGIDEVVFRFGFGADF
jgi:hypothetical protein